MTGSRPRRDPRRRRDAAMLRKEGGMSNRRFPAPTGLCLLVTLALLPVLPAAGPRALHAQTTTCPTLTSGEELREPPVIEAKDHKIDTTFKLEEKTLCVPVTGSSGV